MASNKKNRLNSTTLFQLAIIAVALVVLYPQFRFFGSGWSVIRSADILEIISSIGLLGLSLVFAALAYRALVPKLMLKKTLLIQCAALFANRIIPSGIGGLSLNSIYIKKQARLSLAQSATLSIVNNLLGFVAFSITLLTISLVSSTSIELGQPQPRTLIIILAIAITIIGVALFSPIKNRIMRGLKDVRTALKTLVQHPTRSLLALIYNIGITACYISILWLACRSVGIDISLMDSAVFFTIANTALSVSPTPGGLGVVEASLISALTASGISPDSAIAVTLVYRFVTFWAPLLPGYTAFRYTTANSYVS